MVFKEFAPKLRLLTCFLGVDAQCSRSYHAAGYLANSLLGPSIRITRVPQVTFLALKHGTFTACHVVQVYRWFRVGCILEWLLPSAGKHLTHHWSLKFWAKTWKSSFHKISHFHKKSLTWFWFMQWPCFRTHQLLFVRFHLSHPSPMWALATVSRLTQHTYQLSTNRSDLWHHGKCQQWYISMSLPLCRPLRPALSPDFPT